MSLGDLDTRYVAWLKALLTCGAGGLGGLLFFWFHMPLPWILGSMIVCGLCAILCVPVHIPMMARIPMTMVIGTMLGASFTADVLQQIGAWPIPLAGVAFYVVTCGAVSYCYFRCVARFDYPTAFFSGMPGGVVEMVALGAERGGDERMISLIHAARIFLVVMSTPFLITLLTDILSLGDWPTGFHWKTWIFRLFAGSFCVSRWALSSAIYSSFRRAICSARCW